MTTTPTSDGSRVPIAQVAAVPRGSERRIEGQGPAALTPSGQVAPVFFSTEADGGTELLDVVPSKGFRVARLTAGAEVEMVFAAGEDVGEKLRAELKPIPRGAFVTAILENVVPAMAQAKATFVVAENGRRVAMTGFGPASGLAAISAARASGKGTSAVPANRVPPKPIEPQTPQERGGVVAVPLLKHQVSQLVEHFRAYPDGHLPNGVKVTLRADIERAIARAEKFKTLPKAPDPKGLTTHVVLREGFARWLAKDHFGPSGRKLHPTDVAVVLESFEAALRPPVEVPFVAPPIEPPPVAEAKSFVYETAPGTFGRFSCDVCDKELEDGTEVLRFGVERTIVGGKPGESVVSTTGICKACASQANVSAAMTEIAKHVAAFVNGARS